MRGAAQNKIPSVLEELEPRIAPASDLVVAGIVPILPEGGPLVPGDAGTIVFTIANQASAPSAGQGEHENDANGNTGFHVYLSADQTLDSSDWLVGKAQSISVKLAPGQTSKPIKAKIEMPLLDLGGNSPAAGEYYFLIEADSGERINESNEFNNIGRTEETFSYQFQFGNVGERKGVTLEGTDFKLTLKGGGMGEVTRGADVNIALTGVSAKSTAGGSFLGHELHDITADAAMKGIVFPGAFVTGDVSLPGGIQTLFLGNTGGAGSKIEIGGGPVKQITLGRVSDLDITAEGGIQTLQVIDWHSVSGDIITADFITNLKAMGAPKQNIAANFDADLNLSGDGAPKGMVLGAATIPGAISGGDWSITGLAGKLTLGRVSGLDITATKGIQSLQVVDWNSSGDDDITAPFLTNLKTVGVPKQEIFGDFEANLLLSGVGAPKGLVMQSAVIAGMLADGLWDINGAQTKVDSITARAAAGWNLDAEGSVGTILMTGKGVLGSLLGEEADKTPDGFTLKAAQFGKIEVQGVFDGKVVATGEGGKGGIKDFLVATVSGGSIVESKEGIDQVAVDEWTEGGVLKASWITTIKTLKGKSGAFTPDVTITGRDEPGGGVFAIFDARIKGAVSGTWLATGTVKIFEADSANGADLNFTTVKSFNVGAAKKGAGGGVLFSNSKVIIDDAGTVSVANVDESGAGEQFGIFVGSFDKYTRYKNGAVAKTLAGGPGQSETVEKYRFEGP